MRESLPELLAKAVPSPDLVRNGNGGGQVLALALHVLMVNDGFVPLDAKGRPQPGSWAPPKDWHTKYENEWVFGYWRPGAARRFRLHCSLQAQTRRMFIHASEVDDSDVPLKDNIQVMGLQLDNYVPDASRLKQRSWEGVVANEHTLADMAREFVIQPLWRNAEKLPEALANGSRQGSTGSSGAATWLGDAARALAQPSVALPAAVAVTGAAVAAVLLWQRRQQLQSWWLRG